MLILINREDVLEVPYFQLFLESHEAVPALWGPIPKQGLLQKVTLRGHFSLLIW